MGESHGSSVQWQGCAPWTIFVFPSSTARAASLYLVCLFCPHSTLARVRVRCKLSLALACVAAGPTVREYIQSAYSAHSRQRCSTAATCANGMRYVCT